MSSPWQQATDTWTLYSEALAGLGQHLNEPVWNALMTELRECRGKIVVTGVGTSGIAARKIAHMLSCVERPAIYLNATDAAHGDLGFYARTTGSFCSPVAVTLTSLRAYCRVWPHAACRLSASRKTRTPPLPAPPGW